MESISGRRAKVEGKTLVLLRLLCACASVSQHTLCCHVSWDRQNGWLVGGWCDITLKLQLCVCMHVCVSLYESLTVRVCVCVMVTIISQC